MSWILQNKIVSYTDYPVDLCAQNVGKAENWLLIALNMPAKP